MAYVTVSAEDARTISKMVVRFTLKLDWQSSVPELLKHLPRQQFRTLKDNLVKDRMVIDDGPRLKTRAGKGWSCRSPTETFTSFAKALDLVDMLQLKRRPERQALNLNIASLEDILHFQRINIFKNMRPFLQVMTIIAKPSRVPY